MRSSALPNLGEAISVCGTAYLLVCLPLVQIAKQFEFRRRAADFLLEFNKLLLISFINNHKYTYLW